MTLFIQTDATGAGMGNVNPAQGAADLAVIANFDGGLGVAAAVGNRQAVTYARTDPGIPPVRLDTLVNTNFTPDYGLGAGPQSVNIVIVPAFSNFTRNDGRLITANAGWALPPSNSGLGGAGLNNTTDCLVIYDTTQNNATGYCTARGTTDTLDLPFPNPVLLYHEVSHAFRIVTNAFLSLAGGCNPSSPEESAAITDENDVRTQTATLIGVAPVLRNPANHCGDPGCDTGGCCMVASVASGSPLSEEVAALRSVRDGLLRKSEIGFSFFQSLHYAYYGFSPQVSTLMAQHPSLRPLILEGFVRPLVSTLRLVERHALGNEGPESLGGQFASDHADRAEAAARLSTLRRAREVLDGSDIDLPDVQRELAQLLCERALPNEHVRWALVEPIQLYHSALQAHLDGCGAERLGEHLNEAICSWAVRMPLDDVWASLSVAELREELDLLESTFLRTAEVRASFRQRLKRKFGDVTAIATVLSVKDFVTERNE
jgi:hypothetical protein